MKVQDAGGNTIVASSSAVTLTLTNPAGATLTCNTNPQGAVAGVATFAGCKIDLANSYTLTAAAEGREVCQQPCVGFAAVLGEMLGCLYQPDGVDGGSGAGGVSR